jgi:hypothetical protein
MLGSRHSFIVESAGYLAFNISIHSSPFLSLTAAYRFLDALLEWPASGLIANITGFGSKEQQL